MTREAQVADVTPTIDSIDIAQLLRDFSEESKKILELSAPLVVRGMVLAGRFFLARIILAKKDPLLLSTFADIATLDNLMFALIFKSLRGVSPLVSGAAVTDPKQVGVVFRHCLLFSSTLMLPIGFLCLAAPAIFQLTEQPEAVVSSSRLYFIYMFFAYLLDVFFRVQGRTLAGLKKMTPPLIADIFEALAHLFFTYVFVNGKLGCSEMGVSGYALGYVFAAFLTLLGNTKYLLSQSDLTQYELFNFNGFSSDEFKKVTRNCLPPGIGGVIEQASQIAITFFCGLSGDPVSALIGTEVAKSYSLLISYPTLANAAATGILVAENVKKNNPRYRMIGNTTFGLNIIFASASFLLLLVFSDFFVELFVKNDDAHKNNFQVAKYFVLTQGAIETLNSPRTAGIGALMGFSDTVFPMGVSAGIFILNLILAALAQFYFLTQASTMYATQIAGCFFASLAISDRWHHIEQPENSIINRGISYVSQSVSALCAFWKSPPVQPSVQVMPESHPTNPNENASPPTSPSVVVVTA